MSHTLQLQLFPALVKFKFTTFEQGSCFIMNSATFNDLRFLEGKKNL